MVALDGLLDPEAGETLLTALEPLARPGTAEDERSAAQRRADALTELARRALERGHLPRPAGCAPSSPSPSTWPPCWASQVPRGGAGAWVGPLPTQTVRRLACDAALTRVLVTRHPHHPDRQAGDGHPAPELDDHDPAAALAAGGGRRWRCCRPPWAAPLPTPGRGPRHPGGLPGTTPCAGGAGRRLCGPRGVPGHWPGARGHHLRHWLHGGPTDLANPVLVCRAHHRAIHEGGQRLHLHPNHHQRQPTAA